MVDTIPARLFEQARTRPRDPAHHRKVAGRWEAVDWQTLGATVRQAARALVALGLEPGGATNVLGYNRHEWVVFDLATMAAGGAPAGIYTTNSAAEVAYVVGHSEAPVILVENAEQWHKVAQRRADLPRLRRVVLMDGAPPVDDPLVISWRAFLALGDTVPEAAVDERLAALRADGLATLIYTSGTTGLPKGVMLSHANLTTTADAMLAAVAGVGPQDVVLSHLPLSHIAEQLASVHCPMTAGYQVYFSESLDKVPDNLREVEPTILFAVPRIWEKFHAAVSARLAEATGAKARVARWATGVGREVVSLRNRGRAPGLALGAQYALAQRLFFGKVKPALGLRRAHTCISGAAPIATEVIEFFAGLDLVVHEVYGLSESTGASTFNTPGATRFGTVGRPLRHMEASLAPDGEILLKGAGVFLGYYRDSQATAEALEGEWLHTGDLGRIVDGFVEITGRKKDIIITAGGKNIAPRNIEEALKSIALVGEAVVIGDRRRFLSALITLDPAASARFADEAGVPVASVHADPRLRAHLQGEIDRLNADLAQVEQVRRFTVLDCPFSVEAGELTATLKVRRHVIQERHAAAIEAMYQ